VRNEQTALVERFLPRVFGSGVSSAEFRANIIPFQSLERLVWIAFRTIRAEDDRNRASGIVYAPDGRDHAEYARGAVFNRLVNAPGRATFNALRRLAENPECLIDPPRLQALALERAAKDSESDPWPPAEALAFEQSHETGPHTSPDLQLVALRRLDDTQHDLLHGDFAQGATVRALPNETAVQNGQEMLDFYGGLQGLPARHPGSVRLQFLARSAVKLFKE
jgi:hypothetical protein